MAFKRLFDDKFIGDKQRRTNYRKWSERAIVVGYNGDTQTYDIVITTERLVGVSKRTLNKTIRNVKSTIPTSSLTFSPGDAVLVGYVSEKREHPVIIGGGGNVVQDAAVVTIGGATSEVEGGSSELTGDEGFFQFLPFTTPTCLDVSGLTTCQVDCSLPNPFVTITAQGGIAPFSWSVTIPAGCCVIQNISGPGDNKLTLIPNTVVGQTGFRAFFKDTCHSCLVQLGGSNGCRCRHYIWARPFDCAGDPTPVSENQPGTACSSGGPAPAEDTRSCCPVVGETALQCFTDPFAASPLTTTCTNCSACTGCVGCAATNFTDFIPQTIPVVCGPCDPVGNCCNIQEILSGQFGRIRICDASFDTRSEAQQGLGCCPCDLLFNGLPVTVTDFDGNAITIILTTEV